MEVTEQELEGIEVADKFLKYFKGKHIFVSNLDDNSGAPYHMSNMEFERVAHPLWLRNQKGNGIFFTVNELDQSLDEGRSRTATMCTRVRAVFIDDDNPRNVPRHDFEVIPNLIVETSKGKFHYYWLIDDSEDVAHESWEVFQRKLVKKYDGDKNAKDVSRILRIPGYLHMKNKSNPFTSKLIDSGLPKYKWKALEKLVEGVSASNERMDGDNSRDEYTGDSKTIDESINEIKSGVNYHENLVSISYQLMKEGLPKKYIIITLEGFMNASEDSGSDRWVARFADIERIAEGAFKKDEESKIDISSVIDEEEIENDIEIPWPPGNMGLLAEDANSMAQYQYREVAVLSAVGLVAGIAGRKFNISGTGLNVYLTLIMGTGMGKDSIGKFVTSTLNKVNAGMGTSSHIGAHRYTSSKAMYNDVKNARSKICVFTEAGILMRSKSGDQESILRSLLGWYSKSGRLDWTGTESYSSAENSIPSMNAVALSIISEATPETLLDALEDGGSLENGFLPRQSVYRIVGDRPSMNGNVKDTVRVSLLEALGVLCKKCSSVQSGDSSWECWDFEFESESLEREAKGLCDLYNDKYNYYRRSGDTLKANMVTRMYLKALKFSALASVINHRDLVIRGEEWKWGVAMVEYEFNTLDTFFKGSSYGMIEQDIGKDIAKCMIKLLKGGYGSRFKLSAKDISNQVVPHSKLLVVSTKLQRVRNYREGKLCPADNFRAMIRLMVEQELIDVSHDGRKPMYRPRKELIAFMNESYMSPEELNWGAKAEENRAD